MKRLLSTEEYEIELRRIFVDKSILNYVFESEKQKTGFITYYCIENKIFNEDYKIYLESYTMSPHNVDIFEERKIPISLIYRKLFDKAICSFYGLNKIACNMSSLILILSKLDLNNAIEFIKRIDYLFEGKQREKYTEPTVESLKEIIDCFCSGVQADEVDSIVEDLVFDEIYECLSELPEDIIIDQEFMNKLSVSVSGSSSLVESYLRDDYADYCYEAYREREIDNPEIEYIFER